MAPSSSAATFPHAAGEACVLCGGTRRTYLFVVGRSYAMDDDSERAVRGMLASGATRRKVLVIVDRGGPHATLRDDPRLDLTTMTADAALAALPLATFDGAFLNGALEHADPVALLQRGRAALTPGGDLVAVV